MKPTKSRPATKYETLCLMNRPELKILLASAAFAIKSFLKSSLISKRCSSRREKMVEGGSNELDDVTPRQYAHASNPLKVLSDQLISLEPK